MSQFSTNEAVSLEKSIDSVINEPTKTELIDEIYELKKCCEWIKSNNFKKVCLQFPDHLLPDSSEVALKLQSALGQNIYILADTAYESCCIDYVAAGHVNADAIIHFGPVCFSKTAATIPYLNIYEKNRIDLQVLQISFIETFKNHEDKVTILLDTPYIYMRDEIIAKLPSACVEKIDLNNLNIENDTVLFLGGRNQDRKLPNLKFSYKPKSLYYFNHKNSSIVSYENDEKVLRRRYFLTEKIKDSNTFGVVIGTLGVKNYLQAIERVKKLIDLHKKKYYLISVGKPTVAKLANFPEIDIYIMVTCALNEIYDSREFYKPIVTIYDVEMALNPISHDLNFSYDYNDVISKPIGEIVGDVADVSLLTGNVRGVSNIESGSELVAKEAGTIALNMTYGAGFLAARTWTGLEQELGRTNVKLAEEGRKGIAQQYCDETS